MIHKPKIKQRRKTTAAGSPRPDRSESFSYAQMLQASGMGFHQICSFAPHLAGPATGLFPSP